MKIGDRVIVTGGAWAGYSGEYAGSRETLIGLLHEVELDNGMSTLVPLHQIRVETPEKKIRKPARSRNERP